MTSPDPSSSRVRPERPERSESAGAARQGDQTEQSQQPDRSGPADAAGQSTDQASGPDQAAGPGQPDPSGQVEQGEQGDPGAPAAQSERPDAADRGEPAGAADRAEPADAGRAGRTELRKRPRAGAPEAAGGGRGATRTGQRSQPAGRPRSGGTVRPIDAARDAATDSEVYEDRVYRSTGGLATGVLLLALGAWLGGDALVRGEGRAPWLSLAGLLAAVPLVVAFTLRPAVFAGADRLLVRNPFRTITLPWGSVDGARAGYSSEVLAGGSTYQLWAIPVSLRQRKRASRQQARAAAEDVSGRLPTRTPRPDALAETGRAPSDQAIDDIRELAERQARRESAQGRPEVRWAWEVLAPSAVGVLLLVILASTG